MPSTCAGAFFLSRGTDRRHCSATEAFNANSEGVGAWASAALIAAHGSTLALVALPDGVSAAARM